MRRRTCLSGLALAPALAAMPSFARAADRITGREFATRSEVFARHGMAATSQPLATMAAVDVLQEGGSALDAAICANALLGVVEPVGCGIGGDLFAIVWDAEKKRLYGFNGSGRSPRGLSLDILREQGDSIPAHGPLPVSVPGAVDGWFELHGRFGSLPMSRLLEPAITHARGGFPVTELIAHYWALNSRSLKRFDNFRKTFMTAGGGKRAPKKGEIFKNPDLAGTYERLAKEGRAAFYSGELAEVMGAYMKRVGGYLRKSDLAAHRGEWVKPVRTRYRGHDVWELPPNGQGIAALQILNLLEGYDIAKMGFGSEAYAHTFIEAKKLAFEDRARSYADPDFFDVPVAKLVSKRYARERRKLIGERAARRIDAGPREGDTTYLCTADAKGNMVSLIQSNYRGMGSGMVPDGLGFGFQDRGELFALREGHANVYAPGKRPFHTIIPAFVTKRGKPWLSFGVMGGAAQPQMHAQVLVNLIDFGMNLQEAGDAARILHLGSSQPTGEIMKDGGDVFVERGFSPDVIRGLAQRGHKIGSRSGGFGGYQAVMRGDGVWVGASESRKDGMAAGY